MENKIKVTVEYEKPEMSKFEALMAEYKAAQSLADSTEALLMPLIQVGGKAKYLAICDQLKTLGEQLKEFCIATKKEQPISIWALYQDPYDRPRYFTIAYRPHDNSTKYSFNCEDSYRSGWDFFDWERHSAYLLHEDGLIPRWANKCIISKLQGKLHQLIKDDIAKQNTRSRTFRNTLNGIQN